MTRSLYEVDEIDIDKQNRDRFLVIFANCLFNNCNIDMCWHIESKKIKHPLSQEYLYLLKPNCCEAFRHGLWVCKRDLAEQRLGKLIDAFEVYTSSMEKMSRVDLNNNKNWAVNLKKNVSECCLDLNNMEDMFEYNTEETIKLCDQIIDDLFEFSNNVNVEYSDFEKFMLSPYDCYEQSNCGMQVIEDVDWGY